jgi:2-polyprenyl-3-methyl-5-hydroxy-6-metoxy-1,4-benzoquinol methylase
MRVVTARSVVILAGSEVAMKKAQFDPVALAYAKQVVPRRLPQFLTLAHRLDLTGNEQVLDVGSGPGHLSLQIAEKLKRGGSVHGIDIAPNMVKMAKRMAQHQGTRNTHFRTGTATALPYEAESFNIVVSSNAFPWVPERAQFLNEVYRVLKPSGKLALVTVSNKCYKEFAAAFKTVALKNPNLFPDTKPFRMLGSKGHTLDEVNRLVRMTGLDVTESFLLTTEEPIDAAGYWTRVNAIMNENYLKHLTGEKHKKAKELLFNEMVKAGKRLKITESFCFVFATKPQPTGRF